MENSLYSYDPADKDVFTGYFKSFYDSGAIYEWDKPPKKIEIEAGIAWRKAFGDFAGDSIDRELIRDFILEQRKLRSR